MAPWSGSWLLGLGSFSASSQAKNSKLGPRGIAEVVQKTQLALTAKGLLSLSRLTLAATVHSLSPARFTLTGTAFSHRHTGLLSPTYGLLTPARLTLTGAAWAVCCEGSRRFDTFFDGLERFKTVRDGLERFATVCDCLFFKTVLRVQTV